MDQSGFLGRCWREEKLELDEGRIWHCHVDHLFPSQVQIECESIDQEYEPPMSLDNDPMVAPSGEQNAESTSTEIQGL